MPQSTLAQLQATINERKTASPETSYTAQLLHQGQDKILKKVIEEAGEVLMASKDGEALVSQHHPARPPQPQH